MAVARKVAALVFVLVAAAFSGAAGAAERLLGWPCQVPFAAKIEPAAVWPAPPPVRLDGAWRQRERVVAVVEYATNPENNPTLGMAAISAFAAEARDAALIQVFTGLVEETNSYYAIVVAGVRDFAVKARILTEAVEAADAKIAELADSGQDQTRRAELQQARFWNDRNRDDAEEEAVFLCRRLEYLKKKLRLLSERVHAEMTAE